MLHLDKKTLNLIKTISFIFIIAAIVLTATLSMAAGGGGETPAEAVTLEGVNKGQLEPLEQHWFKFVPAPGQEIDVEKSLTLVFSPNNPNVTPYVGMNLFEVEQIRFFFNGDTGNMAVFGTGSLAEQGSTAELSWTGMVYGPKTYYVQVINNSDFPVEYELYSSEEPPEEVSEPEKPPEEEQPPEAPPPEELTEPGEDPYSPNALSDTGLTRGKLAPNETGWYEFDFPNPENEFSIKELEYTLFFTPDDGNRKHNITFELFDAGQVDFWLRGDGEAGMNSFGAGQIVDRDGDHLTGERLWSGSVLNGNKYLLAIKNGTDVEIDFWLFEGDVYNAELGPKTPAKVQVFAPAESPKTALPLKLGENTGHLNPGEQAWHSFFITDFDNEAFEEMALTMIFTPNDGNREHYVTFDVFGAGEDVQYWSPTDTDNSQITNLGAGSVVVRDDNFLTGERFWKGWVVDNSLYLVQVRNGADVPIDYHVFTGDVYGPPLGGEEAKPVVEITADPGEARQTAFDLALGVNKGQLSPGEEVWYKFTRSDVGAGGASTSFTLAFTPNDGNRVHSVGLEFFEGGQGSSFGQGTVVERDNDVVTGELLWTGNILPNTDYYMKVSNGSDVVIDYWIFPDDVVNVGEGQ